MRCRGFSLIEVLVAMVIASLCVAALFRSSYAVLRERIASERALAMSQIARRSLEEMLSADPESIAEEDVADDIPDFFGPFHRQRQVEPGPRENLWHLRVTVTSSLGAEVSLHTLLRRPWS
jgi:prepilin-type N-terminal cleavage/methylation domain-containing protein